jgi:hypothetical protein
MFLQFLTTNFCAIILLKTEKPVFPLKSTLTNRFLLTSDGAAGSSLSSATADGRGSSTGLNEDQLDFNQRPS